MTKPIAERPDLWDYFVENRRLAARLIAQSRDSQRVFREFRKVRRPGRTTDQTVIELTRALAELVAEKRCEDHDEPEPLTPELKQRASLMVCKLVAGQAGPEHVWATTKNHFTTCDECEADIEYRTWLCEKCRAAKAA